MHNGFDEYDDATTAVAAAQEPAKQAPAGSSEEAVAKALPERAGYKRRINFLWAKGETSFYRVNFLGRDPFLSYWVTVTNGQAKVTPEANAVFKPDSK